MIPKEHTAVIGGCKETCDTNIYIDHLRPDQLRRRAADARADAAALADRLSDATVAMLLSDAVRCELRASQLELNEAQSHACSSSCVVSKPVGVSRSWSGEEKPPLQHALDEMGAFVAERMDALTSTSSSPILKVVALLQTGVIGTSDRGRVALMRFARLTPREADVLYGLQDGKTNKVLAFNLGISPKTVEIHRARIMEKMECETMFELGRLWEAALMVVGTTTDDPEPHHGTA